MHVHGTLYNARSESAHMSEGHTDGLGCEGSVSVVSLCMYECICVCMYMCVCCEYNRIMHVVRVRIEVTVMAWNLRVP
jgi:hypothetical protein